MQLPLIELAPGLNLYHLTPIITEDILEDVGEEDEYRLSIPLGSFSTGLNHGKWFSLSEYHPLYYGWDVQPSKALHYTTTSKLRLVDMRGLELNSDFVMQASHCIRNTKPACIDGWIMKDDPYEDWYEIYLIRPFRNVDPNFEVIEYAPENIKEFYELNELVEMYPYGANERQAIKELTIRVGSARFSDKPIRFPLHFNQEYIDQSGAEAINHTFCQIVLYPY
jgi:hypothetical protein